MSAHSIRSDDYTSTNFLQLLLGTHTNIQSAPSAMNIPSANNIINEHTTKSNGQIHNEILSTHSIRKLVRAHSLADVYVQDLNPSNNFKLFFDALVDGVYDKEQLQHVWKLFEIYSQNSNEMQNFITNFNLKKKAFLIKNVIKEQKMQEQENYQQIEGQKIQNGKIELDRIGISKQRSKTCTKTQPKRSQYKSVGKLQKSQQNQKARIKQQMNYVCKIIEHGSKFINS